MDHATVRDMDYGRFMFTVFFFCALAHTGQATAPLFA